MVVNKDNYGADSIRVLTEVEKVRLRPTMYIPNVSLNWLIHLVYEILSNAIDECINWYWDKIIVRLIDKNTIEIEDFWRWIPFWVSKKLKKEVLELNLTTLHAWWKMDNTNSESAYSTSWWTNGVWVAIVNFLSTNMYVHSWKEGEEAEIEFNNQKTKGAIIKPYKWKRTWTLVRFSPDLAIFKGLKWLVKDNIITKIKEQIYLEKITIIFEDLINEEIETFTNTEWISKFLTDSNEKIITTTNSDDEEIEKNEYTPITWMLKGENITQKAKEWQTIVFDYAFEFIKESKSLIKSFTNSIANPEWWTHRDSMKNWIVKWIKELLKYQWQEGEKILEDFKPEDILLNIIGIISLKMPDPQFASQTKLSLTTEYILKEKIIENVIIRNILTWFTDKDIQNIMDLIKFKISQRKKLEKDEMKLIWLSEKDLQSKLPSKLMDAINPDRMKTELYIVEWDSAGWNIQTERNPQIHAIMPLRWKLINSLKATKESLEKNQEINNLLYAVSWWNIEKNFDIKKHLRYWKIIISADADSDWRHIQNLVIAFFMRFYYSIIEEWHLYIANTPLFSASYKEDVVYFYTDRDKDEFLKKNGTKYHISRFKWLWEMDSAQLKDALLNTKNRSLHQVTVKQWEEAKKYIESLLIEANTKFELIQDYQSIYLEKLENDQLWLKEKTKELIDVVKDNSIEFALEDNLERKIPYIEDWLKHVYRRILYTLKHDLNSKYNDEYIKSAKIVWNVIWDYHPHWDWAAYEAMVWLIQDFRQNIQLIDWKWAYGSIFAPDTFAAYRYTKAKISKFSEDIILDALHKKPVPFMPNFSNTTEEPIVFPAKLPISLIMWLNGIWFWMKHESVSHNIREVIDATIWYLTKKKNEKYDPLNWIKWPDLPTGWFILNEPKDIRRIYESWHGGEFRFRIPLEKAEYKGEDWLLISSVPTGMFDAERLKDKIRELIELGELYWIKKIIDLSGWDSSEKKKWLKFFLMIDKKSNLEMIKENLYSKVKLGWWYWLEYSINYKPLYVNRYKEVRYYTLADMIKSFIDFRRETVIEIFKYDKEKIEKELKTLNNKILFALNIDKIVKIIKENNTRAIIKKKIIEAFPKFNLDDNDAEIIIETRLIQIKDLTALENDVKKKEKELKNIIDTLWNTKKIDKYIIDELTGIKEQYKTMYRKTQFLKIKDIQTIVENKEKFKNMKKQLETEALMKWNYIYIDKQWFITRDFAAQELTIDKNIEKLLEEKSAKKIEQMIINKNNNGSEWKLYLLNEQNTGYFIKTQSLSLKINNEPVNKKIPKYKWWIIIWAFYVDLTDKSTNLDNYILYEDNTWNIWCLKIKSFDLAKSRQWFTLFNNKNKILWFFQNIENIDLSKLDYINLKNYKNQKKHIIDAKDFPIKKSLSSWKILLKK